MSDAELWAAWRLWIVVATVVVLLAAGLLITILAHGAGHSRRSRARTERGRDHSQEHATRLGAADDQPGR